MKVKICGVTRPEDARTAEGAGAGYVGAVLVEDSPRRIDAAGARRIADAVRLPLVLVVADLPPEDAAERAREAGAGALQLHGSEPPETLVRLRELGEWELWKGVRVRSEEEILRAAERYGSLADILLLDGWHPGGLGGTGTPFPWEALEVLLGKLPPGLRLGAAGGLDPENVAEAVARLRPDVVDVSSGVEARPGIKDPERIRRFVRSALAASGTAHPHP